MLQALVFDGLSFDPFSFWQDGSAATEVDVGRRQVVEAAVIVALDEGCDLDFEVAGQEVVFEQNAVLQRLVPAFVALGLGVAWRAARVLYGSFGKPMRQVASDITRPIVGKQPWSLHHSGAIAA